MNLILIEPHELADGEVCLTDRRAHHIATVIHPAVGDTLRVGMIGGARGTAEVLAVAPEGVHLQDCLCSTDRVATMLAHGVYLGVWGARDRQRERDLVKMGVRCVITDHVDRPAP